LIVSVYPLSILECLLQLLALATKSWPDRSCLTIEAQSWPDEGQRYVNRAQELWKTIHDTAEANGYGALIDAEFLNFGSRDMLEALFAGEDLDRFLKKSTVSRTQKSEVRKLQTRPGIC
jgi:hypothetical protein